MTFQFGKNLPKKVLFKARDVGYKANKSAAMKSLLQDKTIAGVLDKKAERNEFFTALKKQVGGYKSLKKNDLKKVLGDFRMGRGKTIDKYEAQKLAGEIFGGSVKKRYIFTPAEKKDYSQPKQSLDQAGKNSPVVNPRQGDMNTVKKGSSSGAGVPSRPRFF